MEDNETVIKTLIETYNVNKINRADEELKDALYEEAKKDDTYRVKINPMEIYNKQEELVKTNERTILKKLIKNHFDPDVVKPMPKFIGGPTTLTVHKSPDEKRMVYIFGEQHTNIHNCSMFENEQDKQNKKWNKKNLNKMTIDYFLYELMKTTSAYLDIYFEIPAFEKEQHGYHPDFQLSRTDNFHLNNLLKKFKYCIGKSRSIKDCALARVHFFDARYKDNKGQLGFLTDVNKLAIKSYHLEHQKLSYIIDFIKENIVILKSLGEESTDESFKEFWIKQLNNNELITKETKSGKDAKIIKHIMEKVIVEKAMNYRDKFKELVTDIFEESKKKSVNKKKLVNVFDDLAKCITDITIIFADIYLLARLFKDFDMTKIETHGNFITDQPSKAHNVIIYAGETHSRLYRHFLNNVAGFEQIASTGKFEEKHNKHCINMETIPQPFFSTWTKTSEK